MGLSLKVGVPYRHPAQRNVPAVDMQPACERITERGHAANFEAVNDRLNGPGLDPGRQAAAPLIHDVESPVLA